MLTTPTPLSMNLLLYPALLATFATHSAVIAAESKERPAWYVDTKSRPVRHSAKQLFPDDTPFSASQLKLLEKIDSVTIDLEVKNLRPAEVLATLNQRLRDAQHNDLMIRADPSLEMNEVRVSFTQTRLRLADALWYLRTNVELKLQGNEMTASSRPNSE